MLSKIRQRFLLAVRIGEPLTVTFALEPGQIFIKWLFRRSQDTCTLGVTYYNFNCRIQMNITCRRIT